jgi:cellobiose-specific phosphotransferase system component IIB
MSVSIDALFPQRSHIDLSDKMLPTDFGLDNFMLSNLFDDVILIEYCDIQGGDAGSEYILRGGIAIPVNQIHNAWRKGRVILNGPRVQYAKVGDIVVFPNNMGIPITNLEIEDHGKIKNGLFINEQRIFGICKVNSKIDSK